MQVNKLTESLNGDSIGFFTWDRSQFNIEIIVYPVVGPTMWFDKIIDNNDIIGTIAYSD